MNYLKRLIGKKVLSIVYQGDVQGVLSLTSCPEFIIKFPDYSLSVFNCYELHNIKNINGIIGSAVINVKSDKNFELMSFSNTAQLLIKLDNQSYKGPEAIVLYGPENLMVVWN
jgi:hypothetical protein